MASITGDPLSSAYLKEQITLAFQEQINKIADEVIKQAKEDIEKEIRGKTAAIAVGMLDKYYLMERMQDNLVITVKHYYKGENDGRG